MAKEIALSLRSERLSDEQIKEILSQNDPFGELIEPKEVSLFFWEDEEKQSSSSELLFALTWDHPEQLPARRCDLAENLGGEMGAAGAVVFWRYNASFWARKKPKKRLVAPSI